MQKSVTFKMGKEKSRFRSQKKNQGGGSNGKGKKPFKKYPKGMCEELDDHVYIMHDTRMADKSIKTTEAILRHVAKTYTHGQDLAKALKARKEFDFAPFKPKAPTRGEVDWERIQEDLQDKIDQINKDKEDALDAIENMDLSKDEDGNARSDQEVRNLRRNLQKEAKEKAIEETEQAGEEAQLQEQEIMPLKQMNDIDKLLLEQQIKQFSYRKQKYEENKPQVYELIWGQCTQAVKNKIQTRKDWETMDMEQNPMKLMEATRELTFNYEDGQCALASVHDSLTAFLTMRQEPNEGMTAYQKRFRAAREMVEAQHGTSLPC